MKNAHAKSYKEVLQELGTDPVTGLTDAAVERNRQKYGPNSFPPPQKRSLLSLILEQFQDKMVLILLFAVVLGFIFAFMEEDPEERVTAFIEPFVIIVILILNATIAVVQDIKAQKSVDALKSFQPNKTHVIRNSTLIEVDAEDVVVGDIVEVGVGFNIPADCRIIKILSTNLKADEAILTGESQPSDKDIDPVEETALNQQKHCMVFGGTPLTAGRFRGVVTAVGVDSEIGKIRDSVNKTEDLATPLQIKLDKFGDVISKSILVICILSWVANINHFKDAGHGSYVKGGLAFFKIAVSLAVAAIPEGLPAVVTTTLSLGVNRMAKEQAIVTKLTAVETLGCTSVICSDKTGTLTTNQMVVEKFSVVNEALVKEFDVEGDSYDPTVGVIKSAGYRVQNVENHNSFHKAALISTICNDATILFAENKYNRSGEPTEAALKVFSEKVGLPPGVSKPEGYDKVHKYYTTTFMRKRTFEFTRDRKCMSVVINNTLLLKGAYEVVLANCTKYLDDITGKILPLTAEVRTRLDQTRKEWSSGKNTYRCIGLAYKEVTDVESWIVNEPSDAKKYENDLVWVGAVGIIDPPRDTVAKSIAECHSAGMRVIMCTGDNPDTATAIARKIGMFKEDESTEGKVYNGNQWNLMTKEQKEEAARKAVVLARVEPIHKLELVSILQAQGEVVAMTGDGVNDSPALKKADIGIAMGSGTKVAQDAAKMILADDSFSTIVKAVSEGRSIYNNTTAFIRYLITCNIGEVVSCFVSSVIGGPVLLKSTQLLFVNLVTDGLPATALGVNPAEPGVMKLKPRSKDEGIVNGFTMTRYLVGGLWLGIATIFSAYWWYMFDPAGPRITFHEILENKIIDNTPSTMAMSVLVIVEMFSALTAVSEMQSILVVPPWKNMMLIWAVLLSVGIHICALEIPVFQKIFSVVSLNSEQWLVVLLTALPTLFIEEIFKFVARRRVQKVDY